MFALLVVGSLVTLFVLGSLAVGNEAAEMEVLRREQPDAYLAKLRAKDPKKWLEELRVLRPAEYEKLMAEKARKEAEKVAERQRIEEARRVKAREEAELAALRASNPDEYLRRIKSKDEDKWEEEFKALRPKEFAKYQEEKRLQAQRKIATENMICKAAMAVLFQHSPSIIRVKREADVVYLTYVRPSDGTKWTNRCVASNGSVMWASETGRWRFDPRDEVLSYEVSSTGIKIVAKYTDGSVEQRAFSFAQLR
jgi:hypothetical protein